MEVLEVLETKVRCVLRTGLGGLLPLGFERRGDGARKTILLRAGRGTCKLAYDLLEEATTSDMKLHGFILLRASMLQLLREGTPEHSSSTNRRPSRLSLWRYSAQGSWDGWRHGRMRRLRGSTLEPMNSWPTANRPAKTWQGPTRSRKLTHRR